MSEPRKKRDGNDILNIVYETWRNETKGQKIIGCWIGGIVIASIWGIYIKRRLSLSRQKENETRITKKLPSSFLLKTDKNLELKFDDCQSDIDHDETPQEETENDSDKNNIGTFREVLDIGIPSIQIPIIHGLISTSLIWESSNISSVNDSIGKMGELLVCKKWVKLSISTMDFAIKTVYASLATSTVNFLSSLLTLLLRNNLTKYFISSKFINKYGNKENISHLYHCKQDIIDIDNRICDDISEFCIKYSLCFISMIKPIITVTIYSNKLIDRIGIYYFQCIFYFIISSLWTRSILPSSSFMKQNLLKYESQFKNNNKRIIEYVEEIHYLYGIETESKILLNSYNLLYNKLSSQSIYDLIYSFIQNDIVRYL
eukprot:286462_1